MSDGWFRTTKNRDGSVGPLVHPFACSLAPLTDLLAPLCSHAPLRSFVRSLAHSHTSQLIEMMDISKSGCSEPWWGGKKTGRRRARGADRRLWQRLEQGDKKDRIKDKSSKKNPCMVLQGERIRIKKERKKERES